MAPSDPAIELDRVSRTFDAGKSRAVNKVSFHVLPGEVVALLGGSGCGKTTTLKMINRLIEPSGGHIFIDGVDNRSLEAIQLRREIGYVFQGIGLFPHMTIYQNIAVVPRMLRWRPADVQLRVEQLMSMVGLDPEKYGGQMPHQLSGGQRQRIGFCRAIAARPKLLLMDEPFGALDPITRDDIQEEFISLQKQLKLTCVMVTHDMTEALLLADRIVVMNQGRVEQFGTPHQLLSRPATEYVSHLLDTPKRHADRLEALAQHEDPRTVSAARRATDQPDASNEHPAAHELPDSEGSDGPELPASFGQQPPT